jgi:hypothetical protein
MANVEVNIDPHLEGQGARVRLGDVNSQTLAAAETLAREVTPDPYDVATSRLRAAAVMQGIAAQAGQPVGDITQHLPPPTTPVTAPGNIPAPNQERIATPVESPRRTRPLQHFGQEPQDQFMGRPLRAIDMEPPTQPVEYGAAPPAKTVTFEIEGFGLHRAKYHDVLVGDGFLVLVYNEAYAGGEMYEPPAGAQTPPMALEVAGGQDVHLVHTTGFSYAYQGHRYCILMVERSAPVQQGQV